MVKVIKERMGQQGSILKPLGEYWNIHVGDLDIDPTKEEFTTLEVQATHMFYHNYHPHFQDHNSWHHFPKVDMNKFDASNLLGWVTQMEHYFSLHGIIDDLHKLNMGILYLDVECWQWWQWYRKAYK
jgi:hypothetical protein